MHCRDSWSIERPCVSRVLCGLDLGSEDSGGYVKGKVVYRALACCRYGGREGCSRRCAARREGGRRAFDIRLDVISSIDGRSK